MFRFPVLTKPYALDNLNAVKLFLYWLRRALPLEAVAWQFQVSRSTATRTIDRVIDAMKTQFVPSHLGFGPEHMFEGKPFTRELVHDELSTWIAEQIGKKIFKKKVAGIADGTYIYMMNFGGFAGNKKLYSGQKKRTLSKVNKLDKLLMQLENLFLAEQC